MTNIWADSFSAIREISLNEKKEKEEKGEKKHKEGPAEENKEKQTEGKSNDGNLANNYPPYDKVTRGDIIAGAKGEDQMGGKRKVKKEERELHSKADKNDKLDVRKGIKNKINTKPSVSEEREQLDELSAQLVHTASMKADEKRRIAANAGDRETAAKKAAQASRLYAGVGPRRAKERMSAKEEFELEEQGNTYGMPAKGDAERQKADPMAAAKAKAARAKVSKERADFQVAQQAQRMKVSTNEAVLSFVEGRTPLFEGVFDPKKSKLRPASERSQNAMTDAQRTAAKKAAARTAEIHSKGETVLQGLRPQGKKGKVQTTPAAKPAAPAANRTVKGKSDKLASAANKILKDLKK